MIRHIAGLQISSPLESRRLDMLFCPSFLPFRYSTSLLGEPGSPSIVVLCWNSELGLIKPVELRTLCYALP